MKNEEWIFGKLPIEIILNIFSYFNITDFAKIPTASKLFNIYSNDDRLWKSFLLNYFPMALEFAKFNKKRIAINHKKIFIEAFIKHKKYMKDNKLSQVEIDLFNTAKDGNISRLEKMDSKCYLPLLNDINLCDEFSCHPYAYAHLSENNKFLEYIYNQEKIQNLNIENDYSSKLINAIYCNKLHVVKSVLNQVLLDVVKDGNYFYRSDILDYQEASKYKFNTPISKIISAICITGNAKILEIIMKKLNEKDQLLVLGNVLYVASCLNSLQILNWVVETQKVNDLLKDALVKGIVYDRTEVIDYLFEKIPTPEFLLLIQQEITRGRLAHKTLLRKFGPFCRDEKCYEIVEVLLKKENVNTVFVGDLLAFQLSIKWLDYDLIKIFLLAGADITQKMSSGETSLEYYQQICKTATQNHEQIYHGNLPADLAQRKLDYLKTIGPLLECALHIDKAFTAIQHEVDYKIVKENLIKAKNFDGEYYDAYINKLKNKNNNDNQDFKLLEMHSQLLEQKEEEQKEGFGPRMWNAFRSTVGY